MKRINLFLILLALASCAWAQTKARYTERLDSIVVYEYWMPSFENLTTCKNYLKSEFSYNAKGQVEQILYYKRWEDDEGGWFLTNKHEYFYDEQGRDTLRVVFLREDGQWELSQKRYNTYDNHGRRVQERTMSYKDGKESSQSRWEYQYNKKGKQVSAVQYKEKQGVWQQTMAVHDEYDAKGNHVKEVYEYLNVPSAEKGTTIMRYDEEGRLTAEIDSIYNALMGGREWQRKDFSYVGRQLSVMKDVVTTIDHDMVHQRMDESLFDPQGNLLQRRCYRQTHGELQHTSSESFFYDLNQEGSSIMGYEFVPEILGLVSKSMGFEEEGIFHHKLMMKSDFLHLDEEEDDEEENMRAETRLFYTILEK
ncbi:MAG: hypothetical protein IJ550_01345 [Bacteroidaceae bacterium]|nr:hypothetical protein [Bacteroidaceae bacterium]